MTCLGSPPGTSAAGTGVTPTPFDIPSRQDDRVVRGRGNRGATEGLATDRKVVTSRSAEAGGRQAVQAPSRSWRYRGASQGAEPRSEYIVEVERGLPFDGGDFAKAVTPSTIRAAGA
jgi:hypothetical protein